MAPNTLAVNRGLLTTADLLRYDPLREDALKYDQAGVGVESRKNVDPYYRDIGVAMNTGQRAVYDAGQKAYSDQIGANNKALADYTTSYNEQMAEADAQAQGLLSQARSQVSGMPSTNWTTFNVVSHGQIEAPYYLDKSASDAIFDQLSKTGGVTVYRGEDGSYNIEVGNKGQEVHDALRGASGQAFSNDQIFQAQRDDANAQIDEVAKQLAAQRQAQVDTYNQNVAQANEMNAELARQKAQITKDLQDNFQRGLANNTSGINNLIASGALVKVATVSKMA